MPRWTKTFAERFEEKYSESDTLSWGGTPCWIWTGGRNPDGYGHICCGGKMISAHRISYERNIGPIPEGLGLDHLCRVRNCMNPAHLEPVSHRENVLRGVNPMAIQARRTHCIRGHELAGNNLKVDSRGKRRCMTCSKEYQRARVRDRSRNTTK